MMRNVRSIWPGPALALALAGAVPVVYADAPRFEFTPFAGFRMGGQFDTQATEAEPARSVDLEDGGGWGLDLGLYRDPGSFYEFLYSTQSTAFDTRDPGLSRVDVQTDYYHLGGTLLFERQRWIVPYLSLTAGATRFSANGGYGSDTKFSLSLGTGLRMPINDTVAITAGLRGYLTFVDSDTKFFCASDNEDAGCLVTSSGETWFQGEAQLGLTLRF